MSIIQKINVWICELCQRTGIITKKPSQYNDPIATPPKEEIWDYVVTKDGKEHFVCLGFFEEI